MCERLAVLILLTLVTAAPTALAEATRPIRIVTTAVGGGNDFVARLTAQSLAERLARPAVVDNRASSVIPGEIVARATPDGDTLLVASNTLWLGPLLEKTPYDPFRDFSPVSLVATAPTLLVMNPAVPARSVPELIALARSRPGTLDYASNATGGSAHLAAELFKRMAAVDMVRVSYKGNAAALTDLAGGRVHLMFGVASAVAPLVSSGKVRALGVSSPHPSKLFPDLPTIAASGLPGYEAVTYTGVFVPARTPASIIDRLHAAVADALAPAAVSERYFKAGMEPVGSTPDTLRSTMKSETMRMAPVIRDITNGGDR